MFVGSLSWFGSRPCLHVCCMQLEHSKPATALFSHFPGRRRISMSNIFMGFAGRNLSFSIAACPLRFVCVLCISCFYPWYGNDFRRRGMRFVPAYVSTCGTCYCFHTVFFNEQNGLSSEFIFLIPSLQRLSACALSYFT
jgi:hypothetical protein